MEWAFSERWYEFVIIAVVCYFIGCFNFAKMIARFKHKDITKIGSGNPGTMNMTREFGLKVGIITFFAMLSRAVFLRSSVISCIENIASRGRTFSFPTLPRYFCGVG